MFARFVQGLTRNAPRTEACSRIPAGQCAGASAIPCPVQDIAAGPAAAPAPDITVGGGDGGPSGVSDGAPTGARRALPPGQASGVANNTSGATGMRVQRAVAAAAAAGVVAALLLC